MEGLRNPFTFGKGGGGGRQFSASCFKHRIGTTTVTQVYNVAPLLHCACCSTHPIYLLERWRRRLSLVCNNENDETSLKMLDGNRT